MSYFNIIHTYILYNKNLSQTVRVHNTFKYCLIPYAIPGLFGFWEREESFTFWGGDGPLSI